MRKRHQPYCPINTIKDTQGQIITDKDQIKRRWWGYFEGLLHPKMRQRETTTFWHKNQQRQRESTWNRRNNHRDNKTSRRTRCSAGVENMRSNLERWNNNNYNNNNNNKSNNNNNNITSMALKSSEAQKRNKTKPVCGWEFIPNDGCSNRESTLAQVQFSSGNRTLLWGRWSELSGDVRKVQETSQIRLLMYCKSAICKTGQFEFDSVINWKPV